MTRMWNEYHRQILSLCIVTIGASSGACHGQESSQGQQSYRFVDALIDDFKASNIRLGDSAANQPFFPIAFFGVSSYGDTQVDGQNSEDIDYDVITMAQGAGFPILLGSRDVFVIGEYVSWSHFDVASNNEIDGVALEDFSVVTLGVPLGWLRQVNPEWQVAGFVMPMLHRSNVRGNSDSWQTMGGLFARYVQSDRLWWAYGLFADHSDDDSYFLPYLGASWAVTDAWTLSAIMPWPSISWAPNQDFLIRFGASPSGASWSFDQGGEDVALNLDSWDLSLAIERRLVGNIWGTLEMGIGGLQSLSFTESEVETPDFDVSSSFFVGMNFNFRPSTD